MAGFHIRGGVADKEAVFGFRAECVQRAEDDVGSGFARETIRALHVIEALDETELLQNRASSRCALGRGGALAPAEDGQRFRDARIYLRHLVSARWINLPVLYKELIEPALGRTWKDVS